MTTQDIGLFRSVCVSGIEPSETMNLLKECPSSQEGQMMLEYPSKVYPAVAGPSCRRRPLRCQAEKSQSQNPGYN
jgi:hypothetical protein